MPTTTNWSALREARKKRNSSWLGIFAGKDGRLRWSPLKFHAVMILDWMGRVNKESMRAHFLAHDCLVFRSSALAGVMLDSDWLELECMERATKMMTNLAWLLPPSLVVVLLVESFLFLLPLPHAMHAVQNDFFWTLTSRPYPLLAFPFLSRSFNASSRCRLLHLCQINKINPGFKPQPLPKLLSRRKRLLPALIYLVIIWCGQCRQNSPLTRFFICCCCCFFYINHWFNVSF